jgi:hypothetical protein
MVWVSPSSPQNPGKQKHRKETPRKLHLICSQFSSERSITKQKLSPGTNLAYGLEGWALAYASTIVYKPYVLHPLPWELMDQIPQGLQVVLKNPVKAQVRYRVYEVFTSPDNGSSSCTLDKTSGDKENHLPVFCSHNLPKNSCVKLVLSPWRAVTRHRRQNNFIL